MTDDGLFAFLASQPLLALTIATILCATLGWRLQVSAPRAGMVLRNAAYVSMVGVALLTVAQLTQKATHSDAALMMREEPKITVTGGRTIIPMEDDGHFWVEAMINGRKIECMIDTGASFVSLTKAAAEEAGITPDPGVPPIQLNTADGRMMAAIGRAESIRFGSIEARGLPVVIAPDDRGTINVIGMNLLSQLGSWHVEGNQLRLEPKA